MDHRHRAISKLEESNEARLEALEAQRSEVQLRHHHLELLLLPLQGSQLGHIGELLVPPKIIQEGSKIRHLKKLPGVSPDVL